MPAIIPFIPLIAAGVGAGTTAYAIHAQGDAADTQANAVRDSTNTQVGAQERATTAQQASAQQALDFQKTLLNQRSAALSPYRNAGTNAFTSLAGSFGLSPTQSASPNPPPVALGPGPSSAAIVPPPQTQNRTPQGTVSTPIPGGASLFTPPTPTAGTQPTTGNGQTAVMRSPDGKETQAVPIDQVGYWLTKGATRVS